MIPTDEKSVAVLRIFGVGEMSDWRRREIATWLRRQANLLVKDGDKYSRKFTARYNLRLDQI